MLTNAFSSWAQIDRNDQIDQGDVNGGVEAMAVEAEEPVLPSIFHTLYASQQVEEEEEHLTYLSEDDIEED